MLDIHEMVTDLSCTVVSLMIVLQQNGILSLDEFEKVKSVVMDSDKYAPIFQDINEQRDLIEKCKSEDEDFLDNVIRGVFDKE